jgi:hypothetical protein
MHRRAVRHGNDRAGASASRHSERQPRMDVKTGNRHRFGHGRASSLMGQPEPDSPARQTPREGRPASHPGSSTSATGRPTPPCLGQTLREDSAAASRSGSSSGRSRASGVLRSWLSNKRGRGGAPRCWGATARGPGASVRKRDCIDRRAGIRHRLPGNWYRRAHWVCHGSHGPFRNHCRRAA